jgi:hypothetical protein
MSMNSARTLLRHNTVSEGRYANAQDINPCRTWSTRTSGPLTTALVITLLDNPKSRSIAGFHESTRYMCPARDLTGRD